MMSADGRGEWSDSAPAGRNLVGRGLPFGALLAFIILAFGIGSPGLFNNPGADGGASSALGAQAVKDELIIRYSRRTGEEAVGRGIDVEYAEVAALALQGSSIPPEQVVVTPLYPEVVDEMRAQGFTENLALLSLIRKYDGPSQRLITSSFFEGLQERNSPYGFARAFVVRFKTQQDVSAIIQAINRGKVFFRSKNLNVRASPVVLSPLVGMRVDSLAGTLPAPIAACSAAGTTVAVLLLSS